MKKQSKEKQWPIYTSKYSLVKEVKNVGMCVGVLPVCL